MNYRDKTLIRGETLLLKVSLYTENSNTGSLELYDADELKSYIENTAQGKIPMLVAEARLSDGKTIPLQIIQDVDKDTGELIQGAMTLYSDYDTWELPGESFDVNMALKYKQDLGFKDEEGNSVETTLQTATFNETFYIANSATDLSERGRLSNVEM